MSRTITISISLAAAMAVGLTVAPMLIAMFAAIAAALPQ
jgi:hypothetical protein